MIIPHHYGITIHEYYGRGKENLFPSLHGCPRKSCGYGGRLRRHGYYERNAISPWFVYRIVIPRYLCSTCGHTVSVLPSFLAPRCQYVLNLIHFVLTLYAGMDCKMENLASILRQLGCMAFSYQHASYYLCRIKRNRGSITALFANRSIFLSQDVDSKEWLRSLAVILSEQSISEFNLAYLVGWQRSFLATAI